MVYFPLGVEHYIIGGALVGLGVLFAFMFRGKPVGASTAFVALLSYVSKLPFLQDKKLLEMRGSRLTFSLGFIIGAALVAVFLGITYVTEVSWWRLIVGGLLVGFGTRMSRGCTAGHGVCGLGSRSWQSLVAVVIFLFFAILTANVLVWLGVGL